MPLLAKTNGDAVTNLLLRKGSEEKESEGKIWKKRYILQIYQNNYEIKTTTCFVLPCKLVEVLGISEGRIECEEDM